MMLVSTEGGGGGVKYETETGYQQISYHIFP